MKARVLVVEDEADLRTLVAYNLKSAGHEVEAVETGFAALQALVRQPPDLVVLDLMLPDLPGTHVCREIRAGETTRAIPVLMLTAKGEEIDRVVGFEVGADDYIVKPFSMRELLLRIRAILRRCEGQATPQSDALLTMGGITIDTERHRVMSMDKEVDLTTTEYKLLLYLAERPGRVLSRELLLQNVWSYNNMGDTRTVDTHITRLRGKLGSPGDLIKTVRGFGYKIEE